MDSKQMAKMFSKFEAELLQKNKEAISNQLAGAMFKIGMEIGTKFWDSNKEMAKIKEEMAAKFANENGQLKAEMAKMRKQKGRMLNVLQKGMAEMREKDEEIVGMKTEIAGQKVQIAKLENNNRAMKRKMERMLFCIPNAKKFFIRRPLPMELINEIFASLPLKNAFGILTKMPNGLLAWNVRKMLLKSVKMANMNK